VRRWLAAAALAGVVCAAPRPARADPRSDLEKAHNAYAAHRYDDAEARLRALLDVQTGTLKDPDAIADARMYLGAVLLAEKRADEASVVFEALLIDRPEYQPDPLRVSLEAQDALTDAKTRLREKLAAIQAEKVRRAQEEKAKAEAERQRQALRLQTLEKLASTAVVTERSSRWIALVPFGVGQFQNRQPAAGWSFLVFESLLVVGSFVGQGLSLYDQNQALSAYRTHNVTIADGYQTRAQELAVAGDAMAGGFLAAAIAGVVHAQLTFVPEHTEVHVRPLPPLSLAPVVGPGGIGIVGRF
jgi:hypothetical protein